MKDGWVIEAQFWKWSSLNLNFMLVRKCFD